MNLTLAFCWKEWRAQRTTLLAYSSLVFACLCLGLSLVPLHSWFEEGFGAHALSWFVVAGILGVLLFVVPTFVTGEFVGKDDQFVRRLPGALGPAFRGKLLFLLLATAALPLLGLVLGEVFVTAWGQHWHGLVQWQWDGSVEFAWPTELLATALALLLVPWMWAIGCWLPRGRMALGGTLLLTLVVGLCVFAVLRQSPKLENGIDWRIWLWAVAPVGLGIAAASWAGRRGGGPLRSARCGSVAMLVGLLPPSLWFAARAYDYHHPDPAALATLDVQGLSPDGRFLLARGAARADWYGPHFRIDLQDGSAERITGIATAFGTELTRPYVLAICAQQRHWLGYGEEGVDQRAFDLATGTFVPIDYDRAKNERHLPEDLRAAVLAERRERTPFRAPGDQRVFVEGTDVCFVESDGTVRRVAVPELQGASVLPAGHGLFVLAGGTTRAFDFTTRRLLPDPVAQGSVFLVRGTLISALDTHTWRKWGQRAPGGETVPIPAFSGCRVFGLLDDDHLLAATWPDKKARTQGPFLYQPADGVREVLALPEGLPAEMYTYAYIEDQTTLSGRGSLLARDPQGGVWLELGSNHHSAFLRLDVATRKLELQFVGGHDEDGAVRLLGFDGPTGVLLRQGARIVRFDRASREQVVLFPRR